MAIGSEPEYGMTFKTGVEGFDWKLWRARVGGDLCGGYAKVIYISQEDRERNIQVYALRHEAEGVETAASSTVAHVQQQES